MSLAKPAFLLSWTIILIGIGYGVFVRGHSMFGKTLYLGLCGALLLILVPVVAEAQTRADLIPLGRSAASGAVCQAVRDYDDSVVQAAGRRAWNIRCRGWEGSLGHLYALPKAAAMQTHLVG